MKETAHNHRTDFERGLVQGRTLAALLRQGTSKKRVRMLEELQEGAAFHEAGALVRSLATCADASLGDDADHTESIRTAAGGFRDAIMSHPPKNGREWGEIDNVFRKTVTGETEMPTPTSGDDNYDDDENVRYRRLGENDD